MYADGWIASCRHGRLPWETSGSSSFADDVWELYHFADDFSQAVDVAADEPERLRLLQDLFMADAARHNVMPLDDRFAERLDVTLRPSYFAGRNHITFHTGMIRLPEGSGPKLVSTPVTITAAVEVDSDTEGVIFALGGDAGGWSLFAWDGKARFHYNYFALRRYDVVSPEPLKPGRHTIEVAITPESEQPGGPANVTMSIDGTQVGEVHLPEQIPQRCGTECIDVGIDCVSPVCDDYGERGLFPFTGTIEHVTLDLPAVQQPTGMDRLELATKMD
jgi:arylsulfatase